MRVLRAHETSVFFPGCVAPTPSEAEIIAREWVEACTSHEELFRLVAAIASQPAAIPLRLRGKTYTTSVFPRDVVVADLASVAELAVLRLSRVYLVSALRLGGRVRAAVEGAIGILPELVNAIGVRRPDLQWFWQSCQYRLRQNRTAARAAAITAAIESPWHFEVNTVSFSDFVKASKRCEARFAAPGTDIVVSGTAAAATSLRDKTLLLLMLLWWEETHYAAGPPPCAPPCIRAITALL